jgi:hypothetical protein
MRSVWGDSGGDQSGASPAGEPASIEVELVADEPLPAGGPAAAASGLETIGGDARGRSRTNRLPRVLKIAGALLAAAALAVAVWPTPARRQAAPHPVPTPSAVNIDLYKVQITGTSLDAEENGDHAVMGLELTNHAPDGVSVVSAELWDAIGTRLGYTTLWPAGAVGPRSTVRVPVLLTYTCDTFGQAPVLPLSIRYSVSSPQNLNVQHDYSSPLDGGVWNSFTHLEAAHCGQNTDSVFVSAIDTTQGGEDPNVDPGERNSFDLTFTFQTAGTAPWSLDAIGDAPSGLAVTTADLPLALGPGQAGSVTTHWRISDCDSPPTWDSGGGVLEIRARMNGPAPGGVGPTSDQRSEIVLHSELLARMVRIACGD